MTRQPPWKWIAIATSTTTVLLALLLLPACCCVKGPAGPATAPAEASKIPPIGAAAMPDFSEDNVRGPVQTEMRNVWFYLDETMFLDIHSLRGTLEAKEKGAPVNFDNKLSFVMRVDKGEIGMTTASLDRLMNAYVFGYPNPPLRNLHITIDGKQLKQEGVMHKIVDIPFTMWADVSADHGLIRLHPTKISICGINGLGLLKAVGENLEKMLPMPKERGVRAEKNDLLLDPSRVLPPPAVELHLASVHTAGDELVQEYDSGKHLGPLALPKPDEKNTMYFRGGTLRMGKLLMVDADMQVVDADPSDPFSFFLDRYNEELSEGFSRNQRNYGLVVFMRDWLDIGQPARPGERRAPGD